MLLDANLREETADALTADIAIIGAGTTGLFLASCLCNSGNKANVILIEAGGQIANTESNSAAAISVGKHHRGTTLGRAAGLGGTSSLWGGQLAEFEAVDLQRLDAPWPISFDELKALYRLVYMRLGLTGLLSKTDLRHEFGGEGESSSPIERFFTHWLKQPSFAKYFRKIIDSEFTRIFLNLTANGIEFIDATATSIMCCAKDGRRVE